MSDASQQRPQRRRGVSAESVSARQQVYEKCLDNNKKQQQQHTPAEKEKPVAAAVDVDTVDSDSSPAASSLTAIVEDDDG